ncbi:hypothetical protein FGSG_12631 [Fusarium graminearum PH-1]|uniref:Chromosome 3, complete genome n=1 Tax=Gibberella zeae (strain ATCC MYA-4620 / CBS 123657 / FGSC 9075 / NRRL 31084 / PH-1) TaxID=229533 RepID=I1S708_GIBZE|nr:hypothetical protein FGSG_12631 [Fusarium graminearum PH-1]ESU10719.1 hypothetical protein FGSG_12631 [Fusarium graminearum PH-1]CEF86661.1 unnamed protein product [Fusarium graminearum]|eukprot:XP_011323295.1 hypothetical protein FGSG_12631 [Fusarium graminearum PH-1]
MNMIMSSLQTLAGKVAVVSGTSYADVVSQKCGEPHSHGDRIYPCRHRVRRLKLGQLLYQFFPSAYNCRLAYTLRPSITSSMAASPDVCASSLRVRLGTKTWWHCSSGYIYMERPRTQHIPALSASETHHNHSNTMKRQAPCEPSDESQQARKRGPSSRPPRASQACRSCAASKVRCDDLEICRRCLKRGVPCIRPTPVGQGYRSAMGEAPCVLSNLSTRTSVDRDGSCILASTIQELAETAPPAIAPINSVARDENRGELTNASFVSPNSPMSLGHPGHSQCSDTQTMDNLGDILLTDTTEWFKNLSFHAEFDTSFLLPLPFIDLSGYPDEILIENPTDLTTMSSESMLPQEKTIFDEAVIAHSSTLGSWKPTHEDYLGAARASLYVPLDEQVLLEEGLGHLNSTVIGGCLSSARRDEIIVAMIDGTQTAQTLLAVRMFPSVEILDRFLKIFLTSQETSALAFVHIPTFDPSTCSLSLLMACIVAGATLSPIASAPSVSHKMPIIRVVVDFERGG